MKTITYPAGKASPKLEESQPITRDMQKLAEKIWNAITKYVTVDKDGIFKDPNWPYMWDHKR